MGKYPLHSGSSQGSTAVAQTGVSKETTKHSSAAQDRRRPQVVSLKAVVQLSRVAALKAVVQLSRVAALKAVVQLRRVAALKAVVQLSREVALKAVAQLSRVAAYRQ